MNDIYAYFDYHGTLKERVSAPVRANSTQVNSIYAYWDNQSVEPVTYSVTWRLVGSDSFETTSEHYAETLAIPANYLRRRDLVFFKEAKSYNFIRFPVPSAVTAVAGTYVATIRYALSTQATFVLGSLTFDVEGDRGIVLGESLTLDQYNYLLERYSEVYDWATLRFLPLTGGTLTGDLTIDGHDLAAGRVFAKELWQQTNDALIMHYDGDSNEIRFGTTSGDFNPTFFGSLGVYMWDGRTKEYPTIRFDYYDGNGDYDETIEERVASQEWANTQYLKLTGGTLTGHTIFNSAATFNSPVTIHSPLTLDSGMTVSGLEIHAGNASFSNNITISAAAPTAASHATRKDYVDNLIASVKANAFQVVQALPQTGEEGIIYLVPVQGEDYYTQYIWEGNSWIDIGDTDVHLSGYLPLSGGSITGDLSVGGNLTIANSKLTNGTHTWTFPSKFGTVATVDDVDTLEGKITSGLITAQKARKDGNGNIIIDTYVMKSRIVDNLTSTYTDRPLSANQGRILNDSISELKELLYEISVSEATYAATSDVFAIPQTIDSNRVLVSPGCVLSKLKGNTASFNQLVNLEYFFTAASGENGVARTKNVSEGTYTFNGTSTAHVVNSGIVSSSFPKLTQGHKYLWKVKLISGSVNVSGKTTSTITGGYLIVPRAIYSGSTNMNVLSAGNEYAVAFTQSGTPETISIAYGFDSGVVFTNAVFQFTLIDLTITGEESLTLDQLKAKYNKYYPYDAGTLYPSIVSKVESWGANLFDGELETGYLDDTTGQPITNNSNVIPTNYIKVRSGQTYTLEAVDSTNRNRIFYEYDENYNLVKRTVVYYPIISLQLTGNTHYVKFVYPNPDLALKICFHFGTATIGYKPYVGKLGAINLPSAPITLRGVNSSQDELVFIEDGQGTYTAKLIRRRALKNLGDCTWSMSSSVTGRFSTQSITDLKPTGDAYVVGDGACARYVGITQTVMNSTTPTAKSWSIHNTAATFFIYDTAYSDAATFKTAMDGIYLDYPLATPTEETLATGLTFEQVSLLFEEGGYMQVENTNSDYTHADTELAFAVKRAD